jgi:hypothetical protein
MSKILILLSSFYLLSAPSFGQLFKQGKKDYNRISDSWDVAAYSQFLIDYPKSNFKLEISNKLICKQRNDRFPELILSNDTVHIAEHINFFDTCANCKSYLPKTALKWLGNEKNDIILLRLKLDSLVCQHFWDSHITNKNIDEYLCFERFLTLYPNCHLKQRALDSLSIRKDRLFWKIALEKNSYIGFKNYLDSLPNGAHCTEAKQLQSDFLLAESLLKEESHAKLTEGLRNLKTRKRLIPFSSEIMDKIKKIEDPEYQNCIKKKNLKDWIAFERRYAGGYYFADVDKKIRIIAGVKADQERSQYGTFVEMTNAESYPIRFEYTSGSNESLIFNLRISESESVIVPNGIYKVRLINDENESEVLSETLKLIGIPKILSCCETNIP